MEKYFSSVEGVDMDKLQISEVGKYSVSKPYDAAEISRIIKAYFPLGINTLIITDATANNGGNTIRFAMDFKYVNSVEISEEQFNILKNNVVVYGFSNVKLINGDYLRVMTALNQDVIFIDAPWGGPEYKSKQNVDLYLGRRNIVNVVDEIIQNNLCSLCVLKVPINYNFSKLFSKISMSRVDIYKVRNYIIICIFMR